MAAGITLDQLAKMSIAAASKAIRKLPKHVAAALLWSWEFRARPEQLPPSSNWRTWVALAGRGWGKTRCGAEWVRSRVKQGYGRIGMIAPTAGDARDVMAEGESGILSVCWEEDRNQAGELTGRPLYEPSKRRITWENGAMATLFSADEPERLRGPQHDTLWCDELAAWRYCRDTWDMSAFGLRIGRDPRALVTTTPKPLAVLREIVKDETTVVTGGSTYENRANLAGAFLDRVTQKYEGTRLGQQELYAKILDEAEGALWTRNILESNRVRVAPESLTRVVVGVDPAISDKAESNETGIVVAGRLGGKRGHGYVMADASGRMSPGEWGKRAVQVYRDFKADKIVAEGNQGGDMVKHTIRTVDPNVPVQIVKATRGKAARAEPIAAIYEQSRIHHVGYLADLEDQLVTWEPLSGMPSPDRLDAVVWALTALFQAAEEQLALQPARTYE